MSTSPNSSTNHAITTWRPDDAEFWKTTGQPIAQRNLWVSIPCLLLSFCVWMLFSVVTINLNNVGFSFTNDQLFTLAGIPSISGALMRVPYSFVVPVVGGRRWTVISTLFLALPCLWLGFAIQDPTTSFNTFVIIALLCGFAGANFASSMANISFFFPKAQQGSALGLNGGLGNLGVSVMQLIAPLAIASGVWAAWMTGYEQADGSVLYLPMAAWIWIPFILLATIAAWFKMNDLKTSETSVKDQLPVLKKGHLWILSVLYLSTFGSFIGFSAGFPMLTKTLFPSVDVTSYVFLGPLVGALMRPLGGMLSDKVGGIKVTAANFVGMAFFTSMLFLTLPKDGAGGSFTLFFICFLFLFATSGIGSGSTFQMISVIFRRITADESLAKGDSEETATKKAATDTAAALGFISAIGAVGGFFIPKAFGMSLALTGSPVNALKIFLVFYVVCVLITWGVYGRKLASSGLATKGKKY